MMMTENMALWESVKKTDPKHVKKVELRGGYTAINPHSQLKRATELWGPYGDKWGVMDLVWTYIGPPEEPINIALDAWFYYLKIGFPISVDMAFQRNQDCRKKLLTEARSKALSTLGFNADVFEGKWDDNRYVVEMEALHGSEEQFEKKASASIRAAGEGQRLNACMGRVIQVFADGNISDSVYGRLVSIGQRRAKDLNVQLEMIPQEFDEDAAFREIENTARNLEATLTQRVRCHTPEEMDAVLRLALGDPEITLSEVTADSEKMTAAMRWFVDRAKSSLGWEGIVQDAMR
jgi:hypothetical protein